MDKKEAKAADDGKSLADLWKESKMHDAVMAELNAPFDKTLEDQAMYTYVQCRPVCVPLYFAHSPSPHGNIMV